MKPDVRKMAIVLKDGVSPDALAPEKVFERFDLASRQASQLWGVLSMTYGEASDAFGALDDDARDNLMSLSSELARGLVDFFRSVKIEVLS